MPVLELLRPYHVFEARQKQPGSYGITNHKDENVVDGGKCAATTRSLSQHDYIHNLEDHPVTAFIWKNFDQRCKLLTYLPVRKPEQISHLRSQTHVDADGLLPLSPPVIFVRFDLQLDQMIRPTEHTGSTSSFSHSREKIFRKSHPRNKRSRPLKSSSNEWLHNCFLPNNSSGLVCDDSSLTISEVLDGDIPKIEKSTKKNSRKKGKKKGKRFKRSSHKKELTETEMRCESTFCETPSFETRAYFDPSCSGEGISESYSSNSATSSGLSVQTLKEKSDDEGSSGNCLNHSITPMAHTSCNEKTDETEPTGSLSEEISYEESSCNQAGLVGNSHHQICSSSIEHIDASSHCCVDQINAAVLDSFLGSWNSGVSVSDGGCSDIKTKSILEENVKISYLGSQMPFSPSCAGIMSYNSTLSSYDEEFEKDKCQSSFIHRSKHQGGPDDVADRAGCLFQNCPSNFQSGIPYKSGREGRKRSVSSNNVYKYRNTNTHGVAGKDSGHSVWQRVQKKDVDECVSRPKNSIPSPQSDVREDLEMSVKKNSFLASRVIRKQKSCKDPCLDETTIKSDAIILDSTVDRPNGILCKSHDEKAMHNAPAKMKIKPGSASKQDPTNYSKKGSHSGKDATRLLKTLDQRDEVLGKSLTVGYHEPPASSGGWTCKDDLQKIEASHSSEVEQHQSEPEEGKETIPDGAQPYPVYANSAQNVENQFIPLSGMSNSEEKGCHEVHSIRSDHILCKDSHHIEGSSTEHCKQDYHSGPLTQKWIPVGRKDVAVSNMAHVDDLVSEKETAIDIEIDKHCSGSSPSTTLSTIPCFSSGSENLAASTINTVHNSSSCNFYQGKMDHCISELETDLHKIVKVVNDAYKLQTISERYHQLTGIPVAEFERVLQSASPLVCQVHNISSCKSCSQNQLVGNSLCQHQIPDISLGSLWHWYEKPASYGLEVKVEDHLMKNLGNTRFEFRAYFVPYLSAVQIFGQTKHLMGSEKKSLNCKETNACRIDAASGKPFQLHTLPIFSVLLPSPHREAATSSPGRPSSSSRNENCKHPVDSTWQGDRELLFEYFESDPPQQRRPLFEKIKELARGDVSSTCNIFGDPSTLECIHLNDIHPASWFSVAWYPIYRIPEGNFRAAFLTYHSLGILIHRNYESEPNNAIHIVSPVVGLQSYNSKGECWFQQSEQKCKDAKKEASSLNPTEILKERLRTLEQTASVMARASVHRGEQKSVNRQPDYEFFLSRRW